MAAPGEGLTPVKTRWTGADDVPVLAANQFSVQFGAASPNGTPEEIYLTIGQATPPLLSGDEEEQRAERSQITEVPSRVIARIALSRTRVLELAGMFSQLVQMLGPAPQDEASSEQ